jgi:hypothetical protein
VLGSCEQRLARTGSTLLVPLSCRRRAASSQACHDLLRIVSVRPPSSCCASHPAVTARAAPPPLQRGSHPRRYSARRTPAVTARGVQV